VSSIIAGAGTLSFAHEVLRPRLLPIPRFLALMVLGVNMLGDGVRDLLDPRLAGRIGK